jgi:putative ABC transport system permease protein
MGMRLQDWFSLSWRALVAHRHRSVLTVLGIAVGITAVVLLTSIGEGIHRFVLAEFTQFGTDLIAVTPGKTSTFGISGALISTVRPLSLDDAVALERLEHVIAVVPVVQGNAQVKTARKGRRTNIIGVGSGVPKVWNIHVAVGRFLPDDRHQRARAFAVIGSKVRDELFSMRNPLGRRIRVGGDRYRVIGVMESKGQLLGFDLDDAVYIPALRALELFNREGLMEIDLLYEPGVPAGRIVSAAKRLLIARHGHEDFTVTTQEQMLDVLGSILDVLTFAVGALGSISLLVGAVGILTIMTITVKERTAEIGLLRALGATRAQLLGLFLGEATALATLGGLTGLTIGIGLSQLLALLVPALPVHISWTYVLLAEVLAVAIGLGAGVLPARHAARMDPVEALRAE